MVFIEFKKKDADRPNVLFVGKSLEAILADTAGGKRFGHWEFSSYRELTSEEAHALQLPFLGQAIQSIEESLHASSMVGSYP